MTPRPYRPRAELEAALERGELDFAITLAIEVTRDTRRPIDLDVALRFLPLLAAARARDYDAWALRWLARWIEESPAATIELAAEVAAALADLPAEPSALDAIRSAAPARGGEAR